MTVPVPIPGFGAASGGCACPAGAAAAGVGRGCDPGGAGFHPRADPHRHGGVPARRAHPGGAVHAAGIADRQRRQPGPDRDRERPRRRSGPHQHPADGGAEPDRAVTLVSNGTYDLNGPDVQALFDHRLLLSPATTPQAFAPDALKADLGKMLTALQSSAAPLVVQFGLPDPIGAFPALARDWGGGSKLRRVGGVWFASDRDRALLLVQTRAGGMDIGRAGSGPGGDPGCFRGHRSWPGAAARGRAGGVRASGGAGHPVGCKAAVHPVRPAGDGAAAVAVPLALGDRGHRRAGHAQHRRRRAGRAVGVRASCMGSRSGSA